MTSPEVIEDPQRHIVVFDCNIYLDVAALLGPPFTWEKFQTAAARHARAAFPCKEQPAVDSLRALAVCTSGSFVGDELLEVWTSSHINDTVCFKACQSTERDARTGHSGLGWTLSQAEEIVDDLIWRIVDASGGGDATHCRPDGTPPLDHEDGMVFGSCTQLAGDDPLSHVYCVTRDRGFLNAYQDERFPKHSRVITPVQFVALVRAARARSAMPPRPRTK